MTARLTAVRFPLPLDPVGIELPRRVGGVALADGPAAWGWAGSPPELPLFTFAAPSCGDAPGWGLDHVVLTTPDLESTTTTLVEAGCDLRGHGTTVRGATAAFLLAGSLIEVISVERESGVRLAGVALESDRPLEDLAHEWRASGYDVVDPHPAKQAGRSIMSLRGHRLAVMTPRA